MEVGVLSQSVPGLGTQPKSRRLRCHPQVPSPGFCPVGATFQPAERTKHRPGAGQCCSVLGSMSHPPCADPRPCSTHMSGSSLAALPKEFGQLSSPQTDSAPSPGSPRARCHTSGPPEQCSGSARGLLSCCPLTVSASPRFAFLSDKGRLSGSALLPGNS